MDKMEEMLKNEDAVRDFNKQVESASLQYNELTSKMVKQGLSGKDALSMDPTALENLYAQAYRLYNSGKYVEATHLFRILILMNGMEPKYMLGFAACFHMLKEYEQAIESYTVCAALDPQSPLPHYHTSDCFIHLKNYIAAMISLEMAIERAGKKPEFSKMKERALLSLESLKHEINSFQSSEAL